MDYSKHSVINKRSRTHPQGLTQYPIASHHLLPTVYSACYAPQAYRGYGPEYGPPVQSTYQHPMLQIIPTYNQLCHPPTFVTPVGWFPVPFIPQITPLSLQPVLQHPLHQERQALMIGPAGWHGDTKDKQLRIFPTELNNGDVIGEDLSDDLEYLFVQQQQQKQQQQQRTRDNNKLKLIKHSSELIVDELLLHTLLSVLTATIPLETANEMRCIPSTDNEEPEEDAPTVNKLMRCIPSTDNEELEEDAPTVNKLMRCIPSTDNEEPEEDAPTVNKLMRCIPSTDNEEPEEDAPTVNKLTSNIPRKTTLNHVDNRASKLLIDGEYYGIVVQFSVQFYVTYAIDCKYMHLHVM